MNNATKIVLQKKSTDLCFPLKGTTVVSSSDSMSFIQYPESMYTIIPLKGADHPGAFGAQRKHHVHEGVDLYADEGAPVYAMVSGKVVFKGPFTGSEVGTPWWCSTEAVAIENEEGVVFHGEIHAKNVEVGDWVEAGTLIGTIARVLKNNKGRPQCMLHVEWYDPGVRESTGLWGLDQEKPKELRDPTVLLLKAAGLASV